MQISSISRAALAVLIFGALACSADRIQSPSGAALSPGPASLGAVDQSAAATYNWHAGDAFLIALNPAFGPDVAEASNGERVELQGTGTLGIHPQSATGGGTFVHKNAAGGVIGSGSWRVTELLSFQSYGTGTTPPTFNAGKAQFRVQIQPTGATFVREGILDVECEVPGSTVPGGTEEGIRLVVPGVANFNESVGGNTLFIKTS
jgi:hypothetical protein